MKEKQKRLMQQGMETAFFDSAVPSEIAYRPQFLYNQIESGKKVLSALEEEFLSCEEFCISVAFITKGGVTPLLQVLKELEHRGVPGRILTTDYQVFSDPSAIRRLAGLSNIEVRMYMCDRQQGFHTKGYLFQKDSVMRVIVGSSNLTLKALTTNKEWNTKIISTEQGEYAREIVQQFEYYWNSNKTKRYEEFIDFYTEEYKIVQQQRKISKQAEIPSIEQYALQPNQMQVRFISNLRKIRSQGEDRALLISATGTGKTYASAFALRDENTKRALFLVHREQIAKQAIASYEKVFGNTRTFGLLSGNARQVQADYLFATMQMMSKPEIMHLFARDAFQTIVIDEVHRAGAESYQRILDYFEPEFWLGMTASPERTDGFDIYGLFDHNIAYEIRLQQALEENLLCPFHYFGITELEIDGEIFDEQIGIRQFQYLVSDERVNYILEQADYYGYSGNRVKGLIFCSRKEEGMELARKFNEKGRRTVFLSGADSQEKRENDIERLVSDSRKDYLEYLITIDIFNEGVDIPEINQVIMLRPTESPIVFVQQLGRGLRKTEGKEYVVILDFIGNYKNNFMIPIALSGDCSYNKDNIRRFVIEGNRVIPGSSTIHFDEVARKRIFNAIDTANFSDIRLIREKYMGLKHKLGHIPALKEFEEFGEIDVMRIFDNPSLGSYYKFLVKYEKEYTVRLSSAEGKTVEFISKKLASGKRVHELALLKRTCSFQTKLLKRLQESLQDEYGIVMPEEERQSVIHVMTNAFSSGSGKKTYAQCVFLQENVEEQDYDLSDIFAEMLKNPQFKAIVEELAEFGIARYQKYYSRRYQNTNLVLYQKYTYEDVCRLLNWENNEVPLNIGGYKFDQRTGTFPVFINYDKSEDIQDTIKYEDRFISQNQLIAISKQSRTIDSEDIQNFLHAQERNIRVELFMRKNKDDKISKEFYYLGRMKATGRVREFTMTNTDKTAVEIEWRLDTPVRDDIYEYMLNG